jgi:Mannosyltransferase (PIG-V)
MRPLGQVAGSRDPGETRERRLLRVLWAGVVISLVAFFFALIYVARLTRLLAGADAAAAAPLLLAAYPFAAFFNAPYTEGLFLLVSVGAFYHLHREQWIAASLFGVLVGLSRPNGCLISIPLAILSAQWLFVQWRGGQGIPSLFRSAAIRLTVAGMSGFAMLAFTAYLHSVTGVWFAWARMQEAWGRTLGTRPMAQGWEWLTTEGLMAVTRGVPFDTLNTLAVLFVLAMLWGVLRRVGPAYATFVALNLFPPIFAGGALSMGRITSTLFPVFIALAARLPKQAVPVWVTAFAVLQGLVTALFFTWRELF